MFRRLIIVAALAAISWPALAQDGSAYHNKPNTGIIATYPLDGSLGSNDPSATASITRTTATYCEQSDGQYAQAASGAACFGAHGLFVAEARTNWLSNSIDFSGWTVTSATVTADQDSGPFATYAGGAEADKVDDTSAAASQNIYDQVADATDGDWTCSVWAKAGTSSNLTMRIATDGTGTATCTSESITGSYVRYSCTKTISGGTYRRCVIYPNTGTAADTGSIYVSGAQLEQSSYASPICLSEGTATTCNADVVTVPSTGWPTAQGAVSFVYTHWQADDTQAGAYLIDGIDTSGVSLWLNGALKTIFIADAGATSTNVVGDALSWSEGRSYLYRATWGSGNVLIYRDGTIVGSASSTEIPGAMGSAVYIGSANGSASFMDGWIKHLEIRR